MARIRADHQYVCRLNVLQMAPIYCLVPGMQADAFANLFAIMAINAALIVTAAVVYGVRKTFIQSKGNLEDEEKSKKISQLKETTYRNLFFFLYVNYLSTCSKTASVLPLACRELCQDEKEEICSKYLKAVYSVSCHDPWYNKLVIVPYISAVYIITLPTIAFVALWRQRRVIVVTTDIRPEISGCTADKIEMIKGM